MQFRLDSFFNPHLAPGVRRLDAILTVTADGDAGAAAARRAVGIVLDNSSSMNLQGKIEAARHAARRCIDLLPRDALFTVVTFGTASQVVVPLCEATDANRAAAHRAVQAIAANGATFMSKGLSALRRELEKAPDAIPYGYFLTDGQNDVDDREDLRRAVEACRGRIGVDCRGVGTDWEPDELRRISSVLLGTADAVPEPANLEADFRACLARALSKATGKVMLRLWQPASARLVSLHQMNPDDIDITALGAPADARSTLWNLGAWGRETRDYHAVFQVGDGGVGEDMLVCRPTVLWDAGAGEGKAAGAPVVATWSEDAGLTARLNPEVAHYTGQAEIAASIRDGLEARDRGNDAEATRLLGRAARIAAASGNEDVTRRLNKVVDVVDATAGTVRLKRGAGKAEALELEMGGTRTVRRRPGA
ncbi:VWA domain-containing protein [Lichenibacterium minor]|uniref:VWA domain-containing protein n=1 Tax=Lichenibacterium minor TaxID=2316528 RepID=A0A4Q2UAN8_9HYPH|nr:VWA domain-containing protein [Lichenibacterium minor]RYC33873.1 VWA domain-containing protein [Lichenibacterium minor]